MCLWFLLWSVLIKDSIYLKGSIHPLLNELWESVLCKELARFVWFVEFTCVVLFVVFPHSCHAWKVDSNTPFHSSYVVEIVFSFSFINLSRGFSILYFQKHNSLFCWLYLLCFCLNYISDPIIFFFRLGLGLLRCSFFAVLLSWELQLLISF